VLAVFLATLVRAVSLGVVAALVCLLLALQDLLKTVLQLLQPTPKLSVFRFQFGDPSREVFLLARP